MAIDISFDDLGDDDDDEMTIKDVVERLEKIAKNTEVTARESQQKLDATSTDKEIEDEESQKAKLTAEQTFEDTSQDGADMVLFPDMDTHTQKIVEAIKQLQDAITQRGIKTGQPLKQEEKPQEIKATPRKTGKGKEGEDVVEEEGNAKKEKKIEYDKDGYALDKNGKRITKNGKEWDERYRKYGLKESDFYKTKDDIEDDKEKEARQTAEEVWKNKNQQSDATKNHGNRVDNLKSFHENKGTQKARDSINNVYGRISTLRDRIGANMTEAEKAGSTSYGLLGSVLGGIKKFAGPIMDIAAVVGILGGMTKWVRSIGDDQFTEGINGFQAVGQTMQDGMYTVGHDLGFTNNSGSDLRQYRQQALDNNLMLYSKGGTALFDTDKWLNNMGVNPAKDQSVQAWVTQMATMGKSTTQIQEKFEELSKQSSKLGVSFKNLSTTVAKNSQYSEAMGGTTKGIEKGTASMDKLLNQWGLKDSAITDLVNGGKATGVMESILINHGLGQLAESANGNPQALYQMIIQYNLGDELLEKTIGLSAQGDMQEFKGNSAMAKEERTYALSTTLASEYGITAQDWRTSARSAESIETGASKMPTTPSLTNNKSELHITLDKGLIGTITQQQGEQQGQYSSTGSELYFQSQNPWVEKHSAD